MKTTTTIHRPFAWLRLATNLCALTAACALTPLATFPSHAAVQYQILKSFGAEPNGANAPIGGMVAASDGVLYGTTSEGGSNYAGTVFRVNKDGSGYGILHHFNVDDGAYPYAGLIEGSDGRLYGTTGFGGTNPAAGGTAFRLNKDGNAFAVLHHFDSAATSKDGFRPRSSLLQASDGMFYGTTERGGTNNDGIVFRVNSDGTSYGIVHHFSSRGRAGLIEASDGMLYGTTYQGGSNGLGAVFKLNKDGSGYAVTHHFGATGTSDGISPLVSLIEGNDGMLYSTTFGGGINRTGGIVFKLNKNGSDYTILHHFGGPNDSANPSVSLVQGSDGALYGVTYGTMFKLNKDGSGYTTLHQFIGSPNDGVEPAGLLQASDGAFYGTTYSGGANSDEFGNPYGIVFRLSFSIAITRIQRTANRTVLDVSGVPYAPHRFQAKPLLDGTWENIGTPPVAGPDGKLQFSWPEPSTQPMRFYRVVWP